MPGSVLFACSTNSVRSPMAEALLRHYHGHRLFVHSVGVRRRDVDPFAIAVMAERGMDLSAHRTRSFDDLDDFNVDLAITLTPEAHHRTLELTRTYAIEVEYWPTEDPTVNEGSREAVLDAFRAVRDFLDRRILERFPIIGAPRI